MDSPTHRVVRAVFSTHTKRTIIVLTDGKREFSLSLTYGELEKLLRIKAELDAAVATNCPSHASIMFGDDVSLCV